MNPLRRPTASALLVVLLLAGAGASGYSRTAYGVWVPGAQPPRG